MNLLDRLERKLGRFALPHLISTVAMGQGAFYVLSRLRPEALSLLYFDPEAIFRGEIWRLFSFVLIPPSSNPIWAFFAIYWLYLMGQGLEQAWGSFKLNVFYFLGLAGQWIAGFLFGGGLSPETMHLTLVLAFATVYPDFEFLFFFVLPMKMRWLGWATAGLLVFQAVRGGAFATLLLAINLLNYAVFFGGWWWRRLRLQNQVLENRAVFARAEQAVAKMPEKRCGKCGKNQDQGDLRLCTCQACGPDGKFWCTDDLGEHLGKRGA